jgi:hypothetical protein
MSSLPTVIQGALRPSLQLIWRRNGGTSVEDLTGSVLSGIIRDRYADVVTDIVGPLVLVDGPSGLFRWDFDLADVVNDGDYLVEFMATWTIGKSPAKTFAANWTIAKSYQE